MTLYCSENRKLQKQSALLKKQSGQLWQSYCTEKIDQLLLSCCTDCSSQQQRGRGGILWLQLNDGSRAFSFQIDLLQLVIINMQELLVEQYRTFSDDIHSLTFLILQQKFAQQQDPLERMIGSYVPQLHHYQPPIDQHKKQQVSLKKTPAFNHKKQFDNTENLHRSVIDIFKAFLLSQFRDFREYLRLTVDIDHLSHILSKVEALRFNSKQFNLVFYLFTCSKRAIRIYLKLREEIIKECTFTSSQYLPISTHNSAKYKQKYHYLDGLRLSRQQWQSFVNIAGFQFDSQFVFYLLGARNEVPAVELIEYCLWLNKQTASQTQSPTKKYEK